MRTKKGDIYGLIDGDTLELRYIGQTTNIDRRKAVHLRRYPNFQVVILEHNPPDGLAAAERRWIKAIRTQGTRLLNQRNGGYGASIEARAKMSASTRKYYESPEARAKTSAALMGNTNTKGHKHTNEARAKMSAAHMGLKLSAETKAKISARMRANS
mgnify:FL=1